MMGYKGNIHFEIATPLNEELDKLPKDLDKCSTVSSIADKIDFLIHGHMRLYPCNYIAYDWLNSAGKFASEYTPEQKAKFEKYIQGQLDKIDLENKDIDFLREKLLIMYSNPVVNYFKTKGEVL